MSLVQRWCEPSFACTVLAASVPSMCREQSGASRPPSQHTCGVRDLEHPVHARVVVQRDGGPGPEQEDPHAEHLRLADMHVGDRGALEPRCPGAGFAFPGTDFQVGGPERSH